MPAVAKKRVDNFNAMIVNLSTGELLDLCMPRIKFLVVFLGIVRRV